MKREEKRYWIALAVDNSIPRPEPDPDSGFWPMYFNASPLVVATEEGDDALCVFSTEGKAISYLREAERRAPITGASQWPLDYYYENAGRLLIPYASVVVDPEHDVTRAAVVPVEDFLAELED